MKKIFLVIVLVTSAFAEQTALSNATDFDSNQTAEVSKNMSLIAAVSATTSGTQTECTGQIMATYCSYSRGDIGRCWFRGQGNVDVAPSLKGTSYSSIDEQYDWCGVYGSGQISQWGGSSRCYEAHVYREKEE